MISLSRSMTQEQRNAMASSPPSLKRALRLPDLIFLNIVAVYTPSTLAQNMPLGSLGLLVWVLALVAFMGPYAAAIADLSRLVPREGGVYAWTHLSFGDFHGFLCGWCYWVNTFLYVPSVFLGIAAVISLFGGGGTSWMEDRPWLVATIAIGTLWTSAALHLVGLQQGKWLQNLGAISRIVMAGAILLAAIWKLTTSGDSTGVDWFSGARVPTDEEMDFWRKAALWPFTLNALVGLDLGAAMSDEADAPRRDIPRSLWIGGGAIALCYLLTYGGILVIGFEETNVIYGHVLAIQSVLVKPEILWTAVIGGFILLVELVGLLGSGAAWLAAPARVPFAIGIDHYLPASFAKVHPRYGTPYVALFVQAIVATILILVNTYGASLQEAYLALLGGSIVLVMVTYLYLFGAWTRLMSRQGPLPWRVWTLSRLGLVATSFGILACFIPPPVVAGIAGFELKIIGSVLVMLFCGLAVYFWERPGGARLRSGEPPMG
jgi:amino acid transporter